MRDQTIERPGVFGLEAITGLRVGAFSGTMHIIGTEDTHQIEVTRLRGKLSVSTDSDGVLSLGREPDFWSSWRLLGQGARPKAVLESWRKLREWKKQVVDLTVAVPRDCPVDARMVSGNLVVSGLRAPVTAWSVSGRITLAGLPNYTHAQTVSGHIESEGVGGELWLSSVSGGLTVAGGSAGTVMAETVSGSIVLDMERSGPGCDIRLVSVSGSITARLPRHNDLVARLHSTSGRVVSAFEEMSDEGMPAMNLSGGVLGSGSGRLWAQSTSGSITLLRREDEV